MGISDVTDFIGMSMTVLSGATGASFDADGEDDAQPKTGLVADNCGTTVRAVPSDKTPGSRMAVVG